MKNYYRDGGLVTAVIVLIAITVGLSAFVFLYAPRSFWILAPVIVLTAGFATGKLIQVTRRTAQYFSLMEQNIDDANKQSLYSFPLGAVIVDSQRNMVWFNENFSRYFKEEAVYGNSIDSITTQTLNAIAGGDGVEVAYNGHFYRVYGAHPENGENRKKYENIYMVYFQDITDYRLLLIENQLSHPVVMIIMIDGYEEMFRANSESETANVTVQIDRLLEDFIAETTGILRKIGHDKFWAVIEERHIEKLLDSRVKLLDKAREIQVTDRMTVTLSIGIGRTAETLAVSEEYARQALDMAMSRGGDQAAVKTANGFEFYGGVSKGVERQTKVKARIMANSLMQVIDASEKVYIMGHAKSDFDCLGAAVGLAGAVRNMGKDARVVLNDSTTLSSTLVSYIRCNEDGQGSIFISPAEALERINDNTLLIIADIHTRDRLDCPELYDSSSRTVVIDHHRKMVNHITDAIIFHNEPNASSTCEMVTEMLGYFGEAGKISTYQAEALLSGIMLDTKFFTLKSGVRTFEAAASLRKMGADTVRVKELFNNTVESYRLKASLVSGAEIYRRCAIACTEDEHEEISVTAAQAADDLLSIIDVDASFTFYKKGGAVFVSARSLGQLNVQVIMETLGGGGHLTMAGTRIEGVALSDVREMLVRAIDKYYDSRNTDK